MSAIEHDGDAGAERRPSFTRYAHVRRMVFETPWAILPSTKRAIDELVALRVQGVRLSAEEVQERIGAGPAHRQPQQQGQIALLPLYGVLMPRADLMSEISGGTALNQFQAQLAAAVSDPSVSAILLDVNSPGGSVSLVPETAIAIREARASKPVVAIADTMCCSAAYWLAAQADEVIASPSAMVGSIGVYMEHDDISGMQEKLGVKTTLISYGANKTLGNEYEALSEEGAAAMQSMVDTFGEMFDADVAVGRGIPVGQVRSAYGRGLTFSAKDALSAGLVDRVDTLAGAISRIAKGQIGARANGDDRQLLAVAEREALKRQVAIMRDFTSDIFAERAIKVKELEKELAVREQLETLSQETAAAEPAEEHIDDEAHAEAAPEELAADGGEDTATAVDPAFARYF